ncbi:MAG: helix-turn-helix domain-containing protein [Polyangiales bacterium]
MTAKGIVREGRGALAAPVEPVFLASQLASMCDVDLKTIHNWCARDGDEGGALECFRTQGGHLRFRHASVMRFMRRWGYPIPDALLADRPHVLLVEPEAARRAELVAALELRRPGDECGEAREGVSTGLWGARRFYLHVWDDPYTALVALGERLGAGAPPHIVVLPAGLEGVDARWLAAARELLGAEALRCVLVDDSGATAALAGEPGVATVVDRRELPAALQRQVEALGWGEARPTARRPRRRRLPIAPKEPIYVASQVAKIWGVDLKTVHSWVDRGDIEAFRTPGRHLRFRRRALLHLLRRYDKDVPEGVAPERPRVMLVAAADAPLAALAPRLSERFELAVETDAVRALANIGLGCSGAALVDAVVVDVAAGDLDGARWSAALRAHPDTRYTLVFAVGADASTHEALRAAGVTATMPEAHPELLDTLLSRALGLGAA